jgi:hypothetical protein
MFPLLITLTSLSHNMDAAPDCHTASASYIYIGLSSKGDTIHTTEHSQAFHHVYPRRLRIVPSALRPGIEICSLMDWVYPRVDRDIDENP